MTLKYTCVKAALEMWCELGDVIDTWHEEECEELAADASRDNCEAVDA